VVVVGAADFGDEQLDLRRAHLGGEDLTERLRIGVAMFLALTSSRE